MQPLNKSTDFIIRPATREDCPLFWHLSNSWRSMKSSPTKWWPLRRNCRHRCLASSPAPKLLLLNTRTVRLALLCSLPITQPFWPSPASISKIFLCSQICAAEALVKSYSLISPNGCERDCGRLEWSVLDWNQPAKDFYQSLDAEPMDGWTVNRLSSDSLIALADQC